MLTHLIVASMHVNMLASVQLKFCFQTISAEYEEQENRPGSEGNPTASLVVI